MRHKIKQAARPPFTRGLAILSAVYLLLLAGCSSRTALNTLTLDITSNQVLPETLAETSGLSCTGSSALTLNDSGNAPVLYRITAQGELADQIPLSVANADWEALATSKVAWFVADIGNNRGQRQTIRVHQINRSSLQPQRQLAFTYAGNTPANNRPYAHDFDAEALAVKDNQLVLFSKSWQSQQARVYQIDLHKPKTKLQPHAMIDTLPGLITGADWDPQTGQFVIVGYDVNALGWFSPFIATLSATFEVTAVAGLPGLSQVEAVCVAQNGEIWLTQERSFWQPARLVRLRLE